jgi:3-oxosteroid 1-dehydrogenase
MMDAAWWNPTFMNPRTGTPHMSLGERSVPGSFIVDSSGERFLNEAESYNDFGNHQYERNKAVPAIPAWMIMDSAYRRRQPFVTFGPMLTRRAGIASGYLYQAPSIEELAGLIGVDVGGLVETAKRFNSFALVGNDFDFARGSKISDNIGAARNAAHNLSLAPVSKPPFFAVRVYPGDIGTKGGLLTDEFARVLDENGGPIRGLYAAGNTSASVMGRRYAGAGATLGPAVVFGSLAVDHISEELGSRND